MDLSVHAGCTGQFHQKGAAALNCQKGGGGRATTYSGQFVLEIKSSQKKKGGGGGGSGPDCHYGELLCWSLVMLL